jgi:hypothetical protein
VTARLCAWEILEHLYLPHEPTHDIDLAATSCYSWVHAVCHLCLESNVLDRSLLAFCAVQIHIAEPHSISRECAVDLYSEAVQELIQNLEYSHERDKAETLGAILALSTCEVCYESSPHDNARPICHQRGRRPRSLSWMFYTNMLLNAATLSISRAAHCKAL